MDHSRWHLCQLSRSRVFQLKKDLSKIQLGSRSAVEFLQQIKAKVDELAVIDRRLSYDDVTFYLLEELGPNYRELASFIQTRDSPISFSELHDKVIVQETYLKQIELQIPFWLPRPMWPLVVTHCSTHHPTLGTGIPIGAVGKEIVAAAVFSPVIPEVVFLKQVDTKILMGVEVFIQWLVLPLVLLLFVKYVAIRVTRHLIVVV